MVRSPRRGSGGRRPAWRAVAHWLGEPRVQLVAIVLLALGLAGLVFSGFLLVQYSDTQDLLSRGKSYMQEGKIAWATRTFQTLVNKQPENYDARVWLGQAYLEMGDTRKAEQEFQVATVIRNSHTGEEGNAVASAESERLQRLALARLYASRGKFSEAENTLTTLLEANQNEPEIKQALFDLYVTWGRQLEEKDKLPLEVIGKYEEALEYAIDYPQESQLKETIVDTLLAEAKRKMPTSSTRSMQAYDASLGLLKRALKQQYTAETLIALGHLYEQAGQLDKAITWYRKAFQLEPTVISIQLFSVLQQKAQALQAKGKDGEAQRYFDEAKHISQLSQMKPEMLYPVELQKLHISPSKWEPETGRFTPVISGTVANKGVHQVAYLDIKAELYLDDQLFTVVTKHLVDNKDLLKPQGKSGSFQGFKLFPEESLSAYQVQNDALKVKLYVAYTPTEPRDWVLKAVHEGEVAFPKPPEPKAADEGNSTNTSSENSSGSNSNAPVPVPPVPGSPT